MSGTKDNCDGNLTGDIMLPRKPATIAVCCGLILFLISGIASSRSGPFQSHQSIRQVVATFVQEELAGEDIELEVGALDDRLRLSRCDIDLEAFWPPSARRLGRGSVGVRCNDSKPWRMFVRVNIKGYESIAVLKTSKVRGEALLASDITYERRDVTTLRDKFLTRTDAVTGYIFRRSVKAGQVVALRMLKAPHVVKRGEQVQIVADSNGIQVTMKGEAMANGTRGSVIRVRNSSSNRIVEGEVVDKGVVRVRF